MFGDDIGDEAGPAVEGKAPVALPLSIIFEEVSALLPILVNAVDQLAPHSPVHLPDALLLPVEESAGSEDHVVDGQPDRPSPVVVQGSVF